MFSEVPLWQLQLHCSGARDLGGIGLPTAKDEEPVFDKEDWARVLVAGAEQFTQGHAARSESG